MQLTQNFSLHEMIKSEAAERHGLDNNPPPHVVQNLKALCVYVLQPVRDYFKTGVKVNSGYRSSAVNVAVGGSKTSDHCYGYAADIEIPGVPNYDVAYFIQYGMPFRQLILEFYTPGVPDSGWVHVSYNPNDLKRQVLTATKVNGRVVYTPGLMR